MIAIVVTGAPHSGVLELPYEIVVERGARARHARS